MLRLSGASVLSVSEPSTNGDTDEGVLMRQILGSVGQYERALIRGRMTAGRQAKLAAGGYGGGHTPYGLTVRSGEFVTDKSTIVEKVTALRKAGASYRAICCRSDGRWCGDERTFTPNQVRHRYADGCGIKWEGDSHGKGY